MTTTRSLVLAKLTLVTLNFAFLHAGCATAPLADQASCSKGDWYELGRRDGAQGATTNRLAEHRNRCKTEIQPEWETMYLNGRNAGLIEYCEPKNGYELGRMGLPYFYVCPPMSEQKFISAYRQGQRAYELENENKKLNAKIDQLAQRLIATSDQYTQKELATKLDVLKQNRSKTKKELDKIIAK